MSADARLPRISRAVGKVVAPVLNPRQPLAAVPYALAAIRGLYQVTRDQAAQIAAQQGQIDQLEARLAALERRGAAGADIPVGYAALMCLPTIRIFPL
jgi:flagella basal body P-ring formation protein FlgA